MQAQGVRLWVEADSLLVQPRRFLGALLCTVAVVLSAITVQALAPPGDTAMLALIYGGLVAFNLLLFFPPGVLTGRPLRIVGALLTTIVPLPLAPLLYNTRPVLADAVLLLAAGISVLARPLGAPLNGFALLVALNLLIPLLLGGAPSLMALGALAAISGTIFASAADAATALLLRGRAPGFERRLLEKELAGFLADLSQSWRSGRIWPQRRLSARIERLRVLRAEIARSAPGSGATLPPDAMLEGVSRCAAALRAQTRATQTSATQTGATQTGAMSAATEMAVTTALASLADAARAYNADNAHQAIEALREAALRPPGPGEPEPPARLLGLALLLSDLIDAAMPWRGKAPGPA